MQDIVVTFRRPIDISKYGFVRAAAKPAADGRFAFLAAHTRPSMARYSYYRILRLL